MSLFVFAGSKTVYLQIGGWLKCSIELDVAVGGDVEPGKNNSACRTKWLSMELTRGLAGAADRDGCEYQLPECSSTCPEDAMFLVAVLLSDTWLTTPSLCGGLGRSV